jgi:hypothetical protein
MAQQIVEYDPKWPRDFEVEAQRLSRALGMLVARIEHIGSTAVPGLPKTDHRHPDHRAKRDRGAAMPTHSSGARLH